MALVSKAFGDIITFTRASTATYFDSAGVLQSAAINTPRFDYDPATLAARGFLIEEARTNHIRNNTMQGAVAGTPGTLPTNWATVGVGLAFNVVGLGTEAGLPYIDIQVVGTTGGTSAGIRFDTNTGIAAVAGQTWTSSAYARMVAGSTTNISVVSINCSFLDAVAGIINSTSVSFTSTISQPSLPLARRTVENVVAGVGTLYARSQIIIAYASGVAIDITLRIGLPQLEGGLGSSVNSGTASGTTTAVVLSAGSATDDIYNGNNLFVNGEYRVITDYVGSTKTATVSPALSVSPSGGYTVFAVGNAAFATSVIPTSGSALTRAADVASVNTLSPWFNATEGTVYAEFMVPQLGRGARLWVFDSGSSTNQIDGTVTGTNNAAIEAVDAGVFSGSVPTVNLVVANTTQKFASTFSTSANETSCLNAGTVASANITLPSAALTNLKLGRQTAGVAPLNGYLRRVVYYPRRLSNAELQSITS